MTTISQPQSAMAPNPAAYAAMQPQLFLKDVQILSQKSVGHHSFSVYKGAAQAIEGFSELAAQTLEHLGRSVQATQTWLGVAAEMNYLRNTTLITAFDAWGFVADAKVAGNKINAYWQEGRTFAIMRTMVGFFLTQVGIVANFSLKLAQYIKAKADEAGIEYDFSKVTNYVQPLAKRAAELGVRTPHLLAVSFFSRAVASLYNYNVESGHITRLRQVNGDLKQLMNFVKLPEVKAVAQKRYDSVNTNYEAQKRMISAAQQELMVAMSLFDTNVGIIETLANYREMNAEEVKVAVANLDTRGKAELITASAMATIGVTQGVKQIQEALEKVRLLESQNSSEPTLIDIKTYLSTLKPNSVASRPGAAAQRTTVSAAQMTTVRQGEQLLARLSENITINPDAPLNAEFFEKAEAANQYEAKLHNLKMSREFWAGVQSTMELAGIALGLSYVQTVYAHRQQLLAALSAGAKMVAGASVFGVNSYEKKSATAAAEMIAVLPQSRSFASVKV